MNIDDVKTEELKIPPVGEIMGEIFKHQRELVKKYIVIERANGFYKPDVDDVPHIDNPQFQHWIKDMFWRVTEELAEAMETYPHNDNIWGNWETNTDGRHFVEEVIDALHFLVEVSIYLNYSWRNIQMPESYPPSNVLCYTLQSLRWWWTDLTLYMGLSANCLKNKPWKSSHMPTDRDKFDRNFGNVWLMFMRFLARSDFTMERIYIMYCKKNQVNQFRQNSNY